MWAETLVSFTAVRF